MFDMGFGEIIIIVLMALVVMGPERLPQAIRLILRWVYYLKQTASTLKETVEQELNIDEIKKDLQTEAIERQAELFRQQAEKTSEDFKKISLKNKEEIACLMDEDETAELQMAHGKEKAA
ncbi:Sec-independent protein translocase protein TatB [Endozoicomonas euniceicola]|uniref:Sec-independent protein translocase protein TatB n=1 Tax=Endozoicomonas euniceicola TaxID=1234143 RepID=A0ABY6GSE1_9GAMM|nr:Sec-independent protein translocase protein TatB [Endozoicomonas euniceicola]UYM15670.1 Sec-independent protein translocase protein TatB [Endozoicomonas euniceicola]